MKQLTCLILMIFSWCVFAEDISKCKLGWNETQEGKHDTAVLLFQECIDKGGLSDKTKARTYRNIGIAQNRNNDLKESILSYNKALSYKPDDPWFDYVNRGNSWSKLNKFEKALSDYNLALSVKPNFNEAYYNRGVLYEKQDDKDRAIIEFKKAYEYGLRTELLYQRFVAYGLLNKE